MPGPAAIWTTPVSPGTRVSVVLEPCVELVVPRPSSPYRFDPQAQTLPLDSSARMWAPPLATWTMPVRPGVSHGLERLVVVPSPICPQALSPQVATLPPASTAALVLSYAEGCTTPAGKVTGCGKLADKLGFATPLPSSPRSPVPRPNNPGAVSAALTCTASADCAAMGAYAQAHAPAAPAKRPSSSFTNRDLHLPVSKPGLAGHEGHEGLICEEAAIVSRGTRYGTPDRKVGREASPRAPSRGGGSQRRERGIHRNGRSTVRPTWPPAAGSG